jgi:predicted nucleic acid-binding protein
MAILSHVTGKSVYLDTNVFIYAVEGFPLFSDELAELFASFDQGKLDAVTSELTLAEALVKPFMDHDALRQEAYVSAIQNSSSLQVLPVTRQVLVEAARTRAESRVRLPDAIHAATARLMGCDAFLTNDDDFAAVHGLNVVVLSEVIS